ASASTWTRRASPGTRRWRATRNAPSAPCWKPPHDTRRRFFPRQATLDGHRPAPVRAVRVRVPGLVDLARAQRPVRRRGQSLRRLAAPELHGVHAQVLTLARASGRGGSAAAAGAPVTALAGRCTCPGRRQDGYTAFPGA